MNLRSRGRLLRRCGFTFVEVLTVMALIGLLVRIAVPRYRDMKQRAVAAAIFADVHAVQVAALGYFTEESEFPPDAPAGQVPPELTNHLPGGFRFARPDYSYDWHVWTEGGGNQLVGIRVSSSDEKLVRYLTRMAGPGFIPVASASQVTFLLSSR